MPTCESVKFCLLYVSRDQDFVFQKPYKITWNYHSKYSKPENHEFPDLDGPAKSIRNSPWSMPPEMIFVSFGSQESHLSNDASSSVKGVGHAELWIIFG